MELLEILQLILIYDNIIQDMLHFVVVFDNYYINWFILIRINELS